MSGRRVVITGVGLATPIGNSLDEVATALQEQRHGIATIDAWAQYPQLVTRLGAPVSGIDFTQYPRKRVRTMGRVALLSLHASDQALTDAGLSPEVLTSGETGLAYGSTHGSSSALEEFCRPLFGVAGAEALQSTSYLKFMSHTCAANLAMTYGITGRVISTCAACVSSSQAIGAGYEAIKYGQQDVMLCGGAEELHFTHALSFDMLFATSTHFNDQPAKSPRPFDADRDGLVVGEGAATLVLENYEHAKVRGARIYAEVVGYGTNCDGSHVTNPSADGMAGAIRKALADAGMSADRIDYVNAHGTGTESGDLAEAAATSAVLGDRVPVSSTKSYTGHTLGACGAIEAAFCLAMMQRGFLASTRNLERVDSRCAPLNHVQGDTREAKLKTVMTNNFAFGGINTSLILSMA